MKSAVAGKRKYEMGARAEAVQAARGRMLQAATDSFSTRYYDDVSLRDVARAADVGLQTLVRHFGSKEELARAAREVARARVLDRREPVPDGDLAEAARALTEDYEITGDATIRFLAQEDRVALFGEFLGEARASHHDWVARKFRQALGRKGLQAYHRRHARLVVATDVYTWKIFRRDFGMSKAQTQTAMRELLEAIVKEEQA